MDEGKALVRSEADSTVAASSTERERAVSSAVLFSGAREVVIDHEGERYRLRHTKNGKLILTK